jgi:hypothetical protein
MDGAFKSSKGWEACALIVSFSSPLSMSLSMRGIFQNIVETTRQGNVSGVALEL